MQDVSGVACIQTQERLSTCKLSIRAASRAEGYWTSSVSNGAPIGPQAMASMDYLGLLGDFGEILRPDDVLLRTFSPRPIVDFITGHNSDRPSWKGKSSTSLKTQLRYHAPSLWLMFRAGSEGYVWLH